MTRRVILTISSLTLLVAACGSDEPEAGVTSQAPSTVVTLPPTTDPATTDSATTDSATTEPAPTEPPTTPAPATTPAPTTQPPTTAPPTTAPATTVPPTSLPDNAIVIDDMGYGSIGEMSAAAELVVYGTVTGERSLGRPRVDEDPAANEYLGLTVDVESVLKGEPVDEVLLGWDAYVVGADGERLATNVMNGIPVPHPGDRLVLFLRALDSDAVEFMGGFPTHGPVSLDGVAFVENGTVAVTDELSGEVIGLRGKTITEIADLVSAA